MKPSHGIEALTPAWNRWVNTYKRQPSGKYSDSEVPIRLRGYSELTIGDLTTKERKAIVVSDDRAARKQCSLMKISVTGTVGILKASVINEQIPLSQTDEILQKMIAAGFYSPIRKVADIM